MEKEEALLLASIWHRKRLLLSSKSIEKANRLFHNIRCFIPQYRQLILCGDIPKEANYIKGAKIVKTKEIEPLRNALRESLAEEEIGAPPVQIIYFNACDGVFQYILKQLDRGWIATTVCKKSIIEKESLNIYEEFKQKEEVIYFLDPVVEDISIEKRIIEDTRGSGKGTRLFMIQMKQSQVNLAFQAIQDEVESGKRITQAYLLETLDVRQKTLEKIIEIGKRERRLDLSDYLEGTPHPIVKFLKQISSIREISLAAVFDKKNLLGHAKYREIVFPTLNFLRLSDKVEAFSKRKFDIGKHWSLRLSAKNKNIFICKNNYLYGFILEKGIDPITFKSTLEKHIEGVFNGKV